MFHIRHPMVLWQTFVIHCKANTNVCLALFCKVIWGAASHRKLHQLLAFEWLVSATTTSPWAPASGGCLGSCRSDTAAWHTATAPAQSQSPAHERTSQKDFSEWWGKSLKHSLRKPVSLLHSSHISLHGLGPKSFLLGEIQARNVASHSFFGCNLQIVWFSRIWNTSLRASLAKAAF